CKLGGPKLAIADTPKALTRASLRLALSIAGAPMDIDQIIITTSSLFVENQSNKRGTAETLRQSNR
ncbi:MAG: hypothetical protein LW850_12220, partial [Planctomycetaceae bacterium]|nr:hypothetical protein [Planctomycetaceae bacterium]